MKKEAKDKSSSFDRQTVSKRMILCSNIRSLEVHNTKLSGLLIFSEIGELRARKIPLLELRNVFKDDYVHLVQRLEDKVYGKFM